MKKPVISQNKNYSNLFDTIDFQQEFNDILTFTSELCEVPSAFLTLIDEDIQHLKAKVGFDMFTIPREIQLFTEDIAKENKLYILPNSGEEPNAKSKDAGNSPSPFAFFAGLPVCDMDNAVIGTLCIMDIKQRALSSIQLKTLNQSVLQIQTILKLGFQNQELQIKKSTLDNIENSKEIIFEINFKGNFTHISSNWTQFSGYQMDETIGNHFSLFIHPEDIEKCTTFVNQTFDKIKSKNSIEYRILNKNGTYLWYSSNLKLIHKEERQFLAGISRDISEIIIANQKLQEQKEFYEKILEKLPIDVAVLDKNHNYLYLNSSSIDGSQIKNYTIGKNDYEHSNYIGRDIAISQNRKKFFSEAQELKKTVEWNEEIKDPGYETGHYSRRIVPIFHEDGSLEMLIEIGIDITDSKKNEAEALGSEQLTNIIIQNVAVGIILKGPNSEVIDYNNIACEMFGVTPEQIASENPIDSNWRTIHQDGTEFKYKDFPSFKAAEQLTPIKNVIMGVFRAKTDDLIWLSADAIPVFDTNNNLQHVVCSFNDITERIKTLEELRISNERFVYSNKATHEAIWDRDFITDNLLFGEGYTNVFGHQTQNKTITIEEYVSLIHPEDREYLLKNYHDALNGKTDNWNGEYRFRKSDGNYAYVNDKATIIRNDKGKVVRAVGAMRDTTYEKRLKDELEISEKQFKGAFENSPTGKAIITSEGYWKEVNDKVCEILGYTKDELNNLTFQDLTHHKDLEEDLTYLKKTITGELDFYSMEKRYIHKNKSIVWGLLSVSVVRDNTGQIIHYISEIIDITERKTIEHENKILTQKNNQLKTIELNEVKNLYRLLADNTVDLVCLHNTDGTFQYVSPSVTNLLGYNPEDLTDKFPADFVHPKDIIKIQNSLSPVTKGGAIEIRFRDINGNYFWFETKTAVVLEKDIIKGYHSTTRNISQRKKAEKAIEKTINQERKLNELRTNLVSTISHEFRTPMTTIRTSAELMAMYIEGHDFENSLKLEKRINTIIHEIDRIVELMNDILTISKDDAGKTNFNPVIVDLKQLCHNVIETNYSNKKEGRKVQLIIQGDIFTVFADTNLMENSIINLLDNAFKYSEGSGDVILKLFSTSAVVGVEVIDFGIGIPETDQPKLCNTFFRASNTNGIQGTGLGLYIVKKFVNRNSGIISLESKLGAGTKVTLQFPLHKSN